MIVFVAPPFHGHLDVLYEAAWHQQCARPEIQVHVIICGWTNVELPIRAARFRLPYTYLHLSPLTQTEPDRFNASRSAELYPLLKAELVERILLESKEPLELIVFDFFCWEAQQVAEELRVPSICSIPAIPPAVCSDTEYHARGMSLSSGDLSFSSWISDAHYKPGSVGQWIWAPPALFARLQATSTTLKQLGPHARFVRLQGSHPSNSLDVQRRGIFVSFGTVVTGNLLRQFGGSESALFQTLLAMYRTIINWAVAEAVPVTIAIPGAADAFRGPLLCDLPTDAHVVIHDLVCNQPEHLRLCELFVTHGGGNSVREALHAQCPMLVVPFFGDQWDAARHVAAESLGSCCEWLPSNRCAPSVNVSTSIYSDMTDMVALSEQLHGSLRRAWLHREQTRNTIVQAMNRHVADRAMVRDSELRTVMWHAGDLLFGVTTDRLQFVQAARLGTAVAIDDLRPFSERYTPACPCPSLVDEYNDVLRLEPEAVQCEIVAARSNPNLHTYAERLEGFHTYLTSMQCVRPASLDSEDERHQVWDMCLHGLDYFTQHHSSSRIYFVLTTFDAAYNEATRRELQHILQNANRFRDRVTFVSIDDFGSVNRFVFDQVVQTPLPDPCGPIPMSEDELIARLDGTCRALKAHLTQAPFFSRLQPSWNERVKAPSSIAAKREHRRFIDDVLGIRLSYPYSEDLYTVAAYLIQLPPDAPIQFSRQYVWEGGKIIYLVGRDRASGVPVEVQLWPSVYLAAFQSEHDDIYKAAAISEADVDASNDRRNQQHTLQQYIDKHAVKLVQ